MKRKRNILLWGPPNMGKSTLAATVMERPSLRRCAYFDYDKSATSIAKYFGESGYGELIEVDAGQSGWSSLMRELTAVQSAARKGEINSIVFDGLSAMYMDDVGIEQADHPDEVEAGGNAAMRLRGPPSSRLNAVTAKLNQISREALAPDFTVVLTAHAKMLGEMNARYAVPDMSENAWIRVFRFAELVLELVRVNNDPPRYIYKDPQHQYHRVKNAAMLAEFDKLAGNKAEMAKLVNIPNLLDLAEKHEAGMARFYDRKQQAAAAAPTTTNDSTADKA